MAPYVSYDYCLFEGGAVRHFEADCQGLVDQHCYSNCFLAQPWLSRLLVNINLPIENVALHYYRNPSFYILLLAPEINF